MLALRSFFKFAMMALIASTLLASTVSADDMPSLRRKPAKPDGALGPTTDAPAAPTSDSPAQPGDEAAQATVLMSYQDAALKRVDVGGGSLVRGVESVGEAIEKSGLGPTRHGVFQVTITMKYERIAQGTYDVALDIGAPSLNLDARLKPEAKAALEAEARTLVTRLRTWRRPMTEAEMRALFGYDERVEIALPEPFAHIKTWRHTVPTLTLRLKTPAKPRPILRYVTVSPDGERDTLYELPVGQAFWLEAQYISLPPRDTTQAATIEWPGGRLDVTLQPTDRLLFYRAGPYYIVPPPEAASPPDASTGDKPAD